MRFSIGTSFAKCSGCQGEDFYPAFPWSPDRRDVVVCARCENQAVLSELVGKRVTLGSPPKPQLAMAARRSHKS